MPSEHQFGAFKTDLEAIIDSWAKALADNKLSLSEFLHCFAVAAGGLENLAKDVAGDSNAYLQLRADIAVLIDEKITPIDLPNIGPFLENNVVDPTIKKVVLGGLDKFREMVLAEGA